MMTIELKVNGQLIRDIKVCQTQHMDTNPLGWCWYDVSYKDDVGRKIEHMAVKHKRMDGALMLTVRVIKEIRKKWGNV